MSSKLCSTTKLPQADGAWPWRWVYTVTLLSAPFQVGAFLNISNITNYPHRTQVALLIYKKVRSRALTTQQALNTTLAENFLNVTGIRTLLVAQQYCRTIFPNYFLAPASLAFVITVPV